MSGAAAAAAGFGKWKRSIYYGIVGIIIELEMVTMLSAYVRFIANKENFNFKKAIKWKEEKEGKK